jgi:hypothetical protein
MLLFTQIIVTKLSNMGLGSGIRDPGSEKTYSGSRIQGVKKAPDPRSGSVTLVHPILNTVKILRENAKLAPGELKERLQNPRQKS